LFKKVSNASDDKVTGERCRYPFPKRAAYKAASYLLKLARK